MELIRKIFRKRNEKDTKEVTKKNQPENLLDSHDSGSSYADKSTSIKWSSLYKKEDWWAVWIGLTIFALSLPSYFGLFTLGWVPAAKTWSDLGQALTTKVFNPWIGLLASFVLLALLLIPVTRFNGVKSKDWFKGFFVIFFIAWAIWILCNYAPVVKVIGSAEVGYIIALLVG